MNKLAVYLFITFNDELCERENHSSFFIIFPWKNINGRFIARLSSFDATGIQSFSNYQIIHSYQIL